MKNIQIETIGQYLNIRLPYDGNRHMEQWFLYQDKEIETHRYADGTLIAVSIKLPEYNEVECKVYK